MTVQDETLATLRAVVDVVAPATDGLPAGSALGAHLHLARSLEQLQPGLPELLRLLLDMYARSSSAESTFAQLDPDAASEVLAALVEDATDELRDAVDALLVFAYGGVFTEASARGADVSPAWAHVGYHGPSTGHLEHRTP